MSVAEAVEPTRPLLFEPLRIRGLELKNRVVVAPMATYSAVEGMPSDWHFAHLAKFAIGGSLANRMGFTLARGGARARGLAGGAAAGPTGAKLGAGL